MDQIIGELNRIIINARKSKGRKYTTETVKEKENLIDELSKQFGKLASHLSDPIRQQKIEEFKALKATAIELLREHVSNDSLKMSNFDSKKASDTIPIFDGKPVHLDIFISMVEMIHSELNEQGKINLIKYIVAMKINDRVRNILLTQNIPRTFDELRQALVTNFRSSKTASSLDSEIRNVKQKGSVSSFREKLNTLISELTLIQFNDLEDSSNEIARSTIRKLNETFQEGLQESIRTAVVAAQPKTLAQAFEIASTQERLLQATDALNIFHIDNRGRRSHNNYNKTNDRHNNYRKQDSNTNCYRNNRNYNNNYNSNRRIPNNYNRNTYNNNNNRHNAKNNYNGKYRNNYNNSNYTDHRHNRNIRTVHQQGNGETLEVQNESPRREDYRFTQ